MIGTALILVLFFAIAAVLVAIGSGAAGPAPARSLKLGGSAIRTAWSRLVSGDLHDGRLATYSGAITAALFGRIERTRFTNEWVLGASVFHLHCHPAEYGFCMEHADVLARDALAGFYLKLGEHGAPEITVRFGDPTSDDTVEPGAIEVLSHAEHKARLAMLAEQRSQRAAAREQPAMGSVEGAQLVRVLGDGPETIPLVFGTNHVGRLSESGGQIAIGTVSRDHAELELLEDRRCVVTAKSTRNGTYIDERPVSASMAEFLPPGGVLGLGKTVAYRLEFSGDGGTDPEA